MIGIDLVEHKDIYDKSEAFIKRVLSEMEFAIYQKITNKKRQVEYIASRFASKEALLKAYKKISNYCRKQQIKKSYKREKKKFAKAASAGFGLFMVLKNDDINDGEKKKWKTKGSVNSQPAQFF